VASHWLAAAAAHHGWGWQSSGWLLLLLHMMAGDGKPLGAAAHHAWLVQLIMGADGKQCLGADGKQCLGADGKPCLAAAAQIMAEDGKPLPGWLQHIMPG
jgi:hypothetical protein